VKLLLDTHAFIWWTSDPQKLSARALAACRDENNTLMFSLLSIWEMQIKHQIGKFTFNLPLAEIVDQQLENGGMTLLPVELDHLLALDKLPLHHKDPFDRLLIAQASVEQAVLVTHDTLISQYPIQTIW
jgi:PIN domain nuclease of toxin-antitoxin system